MAPKVTTSVTSGRPSVTVPVLSNTTVVTDFAFSKAAADLKRSPNRAPAPVPTMMAVGVARPSAQGQEMTRTLTAVVAANSHEYPRKSHVTAATTAIVITTGTKTALTRSAKRDTGAFPEVASSTKRMICAKAVSSPTFVAFITKCPEVTSVAPDTLSPAALATGRLSPVIADSSNVPAPSTISPSTAMRSPVRRTIRSPARRSEAATRSSTPASESLTAVSGTSFMRLVMACVVFPFALASKYLPTVMRVRIIAEESK